MQKEPEKSWIIGPSYASIKGLILGISGAYLLLIWKIDSKSMSL
jgi:hypothetical protein